MCNECLEKRLVSALAILCTLDERLESFYFSLFSEFPELSGFILGEESNKFKNSAGEEIRIEVQDDISATSKHLVTVLDGNESAALLLADIIHAEISLGADETQALEDKLDFELPLDQLGIWIDPIGKIWDMDRKPEFHLIQKAYVYIFRSYAYCLNHEHSPN